jgi:hypothetical protein
VVLGFLGHVKLAERAKLVGDFAAAIAAVVAAIDVGDILCSGD